MLESGHHGGPVAAILLAAMLWSSAPLVALSAENWCNPNDDDPDSKWYWRVDEYPHPMTQPRYCNRYRPSYVCDPDRVITKKEADALDGIIERIRNETLCICPTCSKSRASGITLGVAIMEHVHRANNQPVEQAVRVFAETLRKQWNLGHCDDDILLLISTKDMMSTTLVGPAVSDVFPQEVADQIYLESRGHFSNCNFYLGLESMVQSYFDMLRSHQRVPVQVSSWASCLVLLLVCCSPLPLCCWWCVDVTPLSSLERAFLRLGDGCAICERRRGLAPRSRTCKTTTQRLRPRQSLAVL